MLRTMFDSTKLSLSQRVEMAGYSEFELNILAGVATISEVPAVVSLVVCQGIIELVHLVSRHISMRKDDKVSDNVADFPTPNEDDK